MRGRDRRAADDDAGVVSLAGARGLIGMLEGKMWCVYLRRLLLKLQSDPKSLSLV